MRSRAICLIGLAIIAAVGGVLTLPWLHGQLADPPKLLPPDIVNPLAPPPQSGVRPVAATDTPKADSKVAPAAPAKKPAPIDRFRDLNALPLMTKQLVLATQRGMEWLYRVNQPNGRFLHGYLPALNQPMEGDHFLRQSAATFALARTARFTGDERHAVRAGQAILSLLSETKVDPSAPNVRVPITPSVICNRLAAAGYIVMAIAELPDADADLIAKAEGLCEFIRSQQKADGSLHYTDNLADDATKIDPEGINQYPGPALYGIALSNRNKPAQWKMDFLRKAAPYYQAWFRSRPHPDLVPWMTATFSEAFLQTKAPGYATLVCEMNDWLCQMQYIQADPRHPKWRGGFQGFANGKPTPTPPTIDSALYAQSLADACRMIRHMPTPDMDRYSRYRTAAIWSLQFLTELQYADDNTQHFAPSYRAFLAGAFHPSFHDGNLRVDQTAFAVSAFVQFLTSGAERE